MQMLQALLARVHLSPAPNAARLDDGMDYIQIHHPEVAGKYAHLFDAADGTILPQDKADAAALGKVLNHLPDFRKMMEELAIAEGRLPGDIEVRATGTHGGGTWVDITASSGSSGSNGGNGGDTGSGNNIPGNTSRGSLLGDDDGKSGGAGGNDFLSKKENEENTGPKPENPLDGDDETGQKPDDGPDDKIDKDDSDNDSELNDFNDPAKDRQNRAYSHPELSREKQEKIIATEKGKRPEPHIYLSKSFMQKHMVPFEHGVVRVTTLKNIHEYNSAGGDNAFSMSFEGLVEVIIRTKGKQQKIEKVLGLSPGTLAKGDGVIAIVRATDAPDRRIPAGNEDGANSDWRPGGYTKFGIPEVVASLGDAPYLWMKIDTILDWVEQKNFKSTQPRLTIADIEELKKWLMK